jgi:hypothetical protein
VVVPPVVPVLISVEKGLNTMVLNAALADGGLVTMIE